MDGFVSCSYRVSLVSRSHVFEYSWMQTAGPTVPLTALAAGSLSQRELVLPPYTLQPDARVTFQLRLVVTISGAPPSALRIWEVTTTHSVSVTQLPIVSVVRGSARRLVATQDFALNGSLSRDPNRPPNSVVSLRWTCQVGLWRSAPISSPHSAHFLWHVV